MFSWQNNWTVELLSLTTNPRYLTNQNTRIDVCNCLITGVDIPAMAWPKADFPKYKYPLQENMRENMVEDERCLAKVEELIEQAVNISILILDKYFFMDIFHI